jgi:hypothetical protein
VDSLHCAHGEVLVLIDATDGPDASDFLKPGFQQNTEIRLGLKKHNVSIRHANRQDVILEHAHAVDALGHFNNFDSFQRFIVNEHSSIAAAYYHNAGQLLRAIHLSVLYV